MNGKKFQDDSYRQKCSETTLQSDSKGFFLTFANHFAAETGKNWIKNVFGKQTSDKDRIRVVYTSNESKYLLESFLSNVEEVYRGKNGDLSQKKRLEADELFKKGDTEQSVLVYSQSVLRAPRTGREIEIDSGLSLSLALWNRSQALMKLQKFSCALTDIKQALKECLPAIFKGESYWRMGICYRALKDDNKANVSFDLAEKFLEDDDKLKVLSEDRVKLFKEQMNKKSLKGHSLQDPNEAIPNASNKLSIKRTESLGRFMIANQEIKTGEILVVEPPYAACLMPEMFGNLCQHCFKRLDVAYGCPDCSSLAFCCVECRDEALSTYHRYECHYLDLLIGSGMSILGHAALRMITQLGLEKCLAIYSNKEKERIYKLCTNANLRPPEDFLQRTLLAAFLLRCLQKSGFFGVEHTDRVTPSENEYQIGEMLLFNLQILQFNAHAWGTREYGPDHKIKGSRTAYIGVGIYLTSSLFNHDCHPALSRHFEGKNIVLTTTRPLNPHDVVPENYGPIFTKRSLAERQRSLSSRYWFDCTCLACKQNWPPIGKGLESISKRLRCPTTNCQQAFTLPLNKGSIQCPKCKNDVDLTGNVKLLDWCQEQYNLASKLMDLRKTEAAIDILCSAIDIFYSISLRPNNEAQLAEEMLRDCLADFGNIWEMSVNDNR